MTEITFFKNKYRGKEFQICFVNRYIDFHTVLKGLGICERDCMVVRILSFKLASLILAKFSRFFNVTFGSSQIKIGNWGP